MERFCGHSHTTKKSNLDLTVCPSAYHLFCNGQLLPTDYPWIFLLDQLLGISQTLIFFLDLLLGMLKTLLFFLDLLLGICRL